MKEDFLHYVWQYKKFNFSNLTTVSGEKLTIVNCGQFLELSGPDFFNAQIILDNQKWAGNIEIHIKSSDWYLHNHENDSNYDNVILHVVWEYDVPIFNKNNIEIPTLEIKNFVLKDTLDNYINLKSQKSWIYCENQISSINDFTIQNWKERLFFERLERKEIPILNLLEETANDWEAVLFCMLARNFGLNTNGETFLKMAKSIPFSVIRKESNEVENLEALFFGLTNLIPLHPDDTYSKNLKNRFEYQIQKYQIEKKYIEPIQFFKHRPDNFPTIRLAQLAMIYHLHKNLFSQLITNTTSSTLYSLLHVSISDYWLLHYQFDKQSTFKKKKIAKAFIDLVIINTIIPVKFAYAKSQNKEISESLIELIKSISSEKNSVIEKFATFGIQSINAFDTQSLLQLKKEYCDKSKCLDCSIGITLLKK